MRRDERTRRRRRGLLRRLPPSHLPRRLVDLERLRQTARAMRAVTLQSSCARGSIRSHPRLRPTLIRIERSVQEGATQQPIGRSFVLSTGSVRAEVTTLVGQDGSGDWRDEPQGV